MFAAGDDAAGAFAAFSHAAAVGQVRIRKLLDAGSDHEIRVFLHFAAMRLAILVNDDIWHFELSAWARARVQRGRAASGNSCNVYNIPVTGFGKAVSIA